MRRTLLFIPAALAGGIPAAPWGRYGLFDRKRRYLAWRYRNALALPCVRGWLIGLNLTSL